MILSQPSVSHRWGKDECHAGRTHSEAMMPRRVPSMECLIISFLCLMVLVYGEWCYYVTLVITVFVFSARPSSPRCVVARVVDWWCPWRVGEPPRSGESLIDEDFITPVVVGGNNSELVCPCPFN